MGELAYSNEQRMKALTRLALTHGDCDGVADELIDDEFQVPADTLRYWMLEAHSEQYKRLERELADDSERHTIAALRTTLRVSSTLKLDMIERVGAITNQALTPQALRALADAESKATKELLALTGRPVDGKGDGDTDAMSRLVLGMMDRGLLKPARDFEPAIEHQGDPEEAEAAGESP